MIKQLIGCFSIIVFAAVTVLGRVKLEVNLGFDVHVFAQINAIINSAVAVLLVAALLAVKSKKYQLHKGLMMTAMVFSVLFLVSYICHHLFAGETIHNRKVLPEQSTIWCYLLISRWPDLSCHSFYLLRIVPSSANGPNTKNSPASPGPSGFMWP